MKRLWIIISILGLALAVGACGDDDEEGDREPTPDAGDVADAEEDVAAEDVEEDVAEDVEEDAAEDVEEDVAEDVEEDVAEDVEEDAPADVVEDAPADVAEDAPADVAEDAPADVAEDTAGDVVADADDAGGEVGGVDAAQPLPTCTIDFDTDCPDTTAVCQSSFGGDGSCQTVSTGTCSVSGTEAFLVSDGSTDIDFGGPVNEIELYFVHGSAGASGTMTFFDKNGDGVDVTSTNGDCSATQPALQTITFSTPVRSAGIAAVGDVWIDSLTVNP